MTKVYIRQIMHVLSSHLGPLILILPLLLSKEAKQRFALKMQSEKYMYDEAEVWNEIMNVA